MTRAAVIVVARDIDTVPVPAVKKLLGSAIVLQMLSLLSKAATLLQGNPPK
jgi:hypothetical protein